MSIANRIELCIDNYEEYVAIMAAMPDKELANRIDDVHLQMELAEQKKDEEVMQLLEIWRSQLIDARIFKAENNIADVPNEIEITVADIETFTEKTEKRTNIIHSSNNSESETISKQTPSDNTTQLSMF